MVFAETVPAQPASEFAYFRLLHELLPEPFFQTQPFLIFFAVVAGVYWMTPRRWKEIRVWWLVIASFHFYAAWSAELAFLVAGTTVVDYTLARLMDRTANPRGRRALMLASIGMNLGILAYFKYKNFFLGSLNTMLDSAGVPGPFDTLSILVPFGISFYTFEAISYAVDVYRKKIPAERSLPHFLLFILFFPHLVAGPIVRAGDFLKQTRRIKRWNWVRVQVGVQFFLMGVFKKLAIADRMAAFSDGPLQNPGEYSTASVWLAVMAYALRIYADFSGYTDMAIGLAHLFGYKLNKNFDMPYLASNVSEFWKRWHISLSSWLRDYVYIPLGGNRGGGWATNRNLMLTMALGGLWHGASWSYVLWGVIHGALLISHRQFLAWCADKPGVNALLESTPGTIVRTALTFTAVSFAWIFFRPDVAGAWRVLERMFVYGPGKPLDLNNRSLWYTVLFVLACHILVDRGLWQRIWARMPSVGQGLGYAACLTLAMLLAPPTAKTFIYFTF